MAVMNADATLLGNVRLADGRHVDIRMAGGAIEAVGRGPRRDGARK